MTGSLLAHAISLAHGWAAALIVLSIFNVAGLLLTPRRWQGWIRWPDSVVLGLALYVLLCWIAITSRNIPLVYLFFVYAALLWAVASMRPRLEPSLAARVRTRAAAQWVVDFSILYVLAYMLIRPAAGSAFLPLGADGNLDLVTYARYARHLLSFGTANVDLAPFDYLRSPASAYVLAGEAILFGRDPLNAAMPTLLMLAALFGMVASEAARLVFGLSRRVAMAIACIALCGPLFRWMLASYGLAELLAATAVMYLLMVLGRSLAERPIAGSSALGAVAGVSLLAFAAPPWAGWVGAAASGLVELLSRMPFVSLLGSPGNTPSAADLSDPMSAAAVVVLAIVPLLWAGAVYAVRRFNIFDRIGPSESDRRLATALGFYVGVALIVGNVAVEAVRGPSSVSRSGTWRQLDEVGALSFRSMTLKVADEPNGLSTALAMYYLPGRKTEVFGRGVSLQGLSFESVSKEQPMFIQNFGCAGVGHTDAVSVPRVGCVLMAPPSMAIGTSYPFNQTFLFLSFDYMTPREPGGRWNTRPTLHLRATADPQRVRLDRDLFINLLVDAFLTEGAKPRRLVVTWGADQRGETLLGVRKWFSLPVRSGDWTGNRLWTLPITIDFPDRRAILFQSMEMTETPRGDVVVRENTTTGAK